VIAWIKCVDTSDNFGSFLVERLEKGFGVTLGNALRRVMIGYFTGLMPITRI